MLATSSCSDDRGGYEAARPARHLTVRSGLVRRLVQAYDDPGKQRIRAWFRELDDGQLSGLGLTPEDIYVLRH